MRLSVAIEPMVARAGGNRRQGHRGAVDERVWSGERLRLSRTCTPRVEAFALMSTILDTMSAIVYIADVNDV
jgi:hypothetical protein